MCPPRSTEPTVPAAHVVGSGSHQKKRGKLRDRWRPASGSWLPTRESDKQSHTSVVWSRFYSQCLGTWSVPDLGLDCQHKSRINSLTRQFHSHSSRFYGRLCLTNSLARQFYGHVSMVNVLGLDQSQSWDQSSPETLMSRDSIGPRSGSWLPTRESDKQSHTLVLQESDSTDVWELTCETVHVSLVNISVVVPSKVSSIVWEVNAHTWVLSRVCTDLSDYFKIIGFFCKRALWKRLYSAKETYHLKEPTHRSHPTVVP